MNEPARAGDVGPGSADAVTGAGTALSAVTMVAVAVPVRRGVDEVAVWIAAAAAVIALVAFLVARYGLVGRRLAGWAAALSSFAVVLLTGYALNQGIAVSAAFPALPWAIPSVFVAFVAAGTAVGIGVAASAGVDAAGLRRRGARAAALTLLGLGGLFVAAVTTNLLGIPAVLALGTLTEVQQTILGQFGFALGTAALAVGYLNWTAQDRSYVDIRTPTLRDVAWTVAGVVVIFGALFTIGFVFTATGVETSDHGSFERAQENPEILLVLIPASILVIGPFEELLYRNVIQKGLYETFSRFGAVVVASVIFALVHAPAYGIAGEGVGDVIASLSVVFGLALVLGTVYERTENLLVPGVVHGLYNAIVFANLYFSFV